MGKTLLLTGDPGCGKTTIIRKVIAKLGKRAGGFYTEEIVGPGGRKGFNLITLEGRQVILSHKDYDGPQYPQIGRYGVDIKALDQVGVAALKKAQTQGQIVIVDEIGKMELLSPLFQEILLGIILGPNLVLGTIFAKPHPHGDIFKSLAQVTLWEVEDRNRNELPEKVLHWLEKA